MPRLLVAESSPEIKELAVAATDEQYIMVVRRDSGVPKMVFTFDRKSKELRVNDVVGSNQDRTLFLNYLSLLENNKKVHGFDIEKKGSAI